MSYNLAGLPVEYRPRVVRYLAALDGLRNTAPPGILGFTGLVWQISVEYGVHKVEDSFDVGAFKFQQQAGLNGSNPSSMDEIVFQELGHNNVKLAWEKADLGYLFDREALATPTNWGRPLSSRPESYARATIKARWDLWKKGVYRVLNNNPLCITSPTKRLWDTGQFANFKDDEQGTFDNVVLNTPYSITAALDLLSLWTNMLDATGNKREDRPNVFFYGDAIEQQVLADFDPSWRINGTSSDERVRGKFQLLKCPDLSNASDYGFMLLNQNPGPDEPLSAPIVRLLGNGGDLEVESFVGRPEDAKFRGKVGALVTERIATAALDPHSTIRATPLATIPGT